MLDLRTCTSFCIENEVLRKIFGPKSDEVRGEWRRLYMKELNDAYSSASFIHVIK
jgi:hypothetical protein